MNALDILKQYFGYPSFKKGQKRIIGQILSGRDALAIMPTGAGKSICYQVPALMLPGITLVISPLISLMQDQVKALSEAGIRAAYINSTLTEAQIQKALDYALQGKYKIIYVAPERLESPDFTRFACKAEISMVTVDEAHCISQWGQDFRPSYLKITGFVDSLPRRPILSAFTATATEEVKNDIVCILGLNDPDIVITGFDRENLYYRVESIRDKDSFIEEYILKHPEESGIIYCATRKNVDKLYTLLSVKGISVTRYHAGMENSIRKANQDDFIYDRANIMVATNAFGMGIDKPDVRFVIHYNMPQSMENYYQEAGRAGRDGLTSQCILLFSPQDIMINRFLLEKKEFTDVLPEDAELIRQRDMKRLRSMEAYCRTTGCLRNSILSYFGEKTGEPCDNCGNCHREYTEKDMTEEAKQVINCVAETRGRYGQVIVTGILMGAKRARLQELGMTGYKTYGALKEMSEKEIRQLINQMLLDSYLYQTDDRYGLLIMGDISPLKNGTARVIVRKYEEKQDPGKSKQRVRRTADVLTRAGFELFDLLRKLRMDIAHEEKMPPYIIFGDRTLIDMIVRLPRTGSDMMNVYGVSVNKLDKYGERFLEIINQYCSQHPETVLSIPDETEDTAEPVPTKVRKSKPRMSHFCIQAQEAALFHYEDLYFVSDITDELNRICTAENIKKATPGMVTTYLKMEGYIEKEKLDNGYSVYKQTGKGLDAGIVAVSRTSQDGRKYTLLLYPRPIQKMIVAHFTETKDEQ